MSLVRVGGKVLATGFVRNVSYLSFTTCCYDIPRMGSDFDPQEQAEAAMREPGD